MLLPLSNKLIRRSVLLPFRSGFVCIFTCRIRGAIGLLLKIPFFANREILIEDEMKGQVKTGLITSKLSSPL